MKKVIRFNKFFPVAVVLSALVIISGIFALCTRGLNWGLEFKPDFLEKINMKIRIRPRPRIMAMIP